MKLNSRILFAEDNQDHAYLIRRCLEPIGFQLEHRQDGEVTLRTLSDGCENSFDLILLDVNLPHLDGLSVLEQLRFNDRWKRTPVVIFSTSRLAIDRERAYRYGANAYVAKPAGFMEFRETLIKLSIYWTQINVLT